MVTLLPNRECGTCTVCCKVPTIDDPALRKLPGVLCKNCTPEHRCGIYETRPSDCRDFYCVWRMIPLGDEWRPDRSEILIVMMDGTAPDGLEGGVRFDLFGARGKIFWPPLVNYMAQLIQENTPVYLSVPGEPGHVAGQVYLNNDKPLRRAIALRDFSLATTILSNMVQACIRFPKEKVEFKSEAPDSTATANR